MLEREKISSLFIPPERMFCAVKEGRKVNEIINEWHFQKNNLATKRNGPEWLQHFLINNFIVESVFQSHNSASGPFIPQMWATPQSKMIYI